jgi:phage-related protein
MDDVKPLVWIHGKVKTPPFSSEARFEAGILLRRLQQGENIGMPHSRPMPSIDKSCHELRIEDDNQTWRIVYAIEPDAIVILEVFPKKTTATPRTVIDNARKRLREYRTI